MRLPSAARTPIGAATAFIAGILVLLGLVPPLYFTRIVSLGDAILSQTDPLIGTVDDLTQALVDQETGERGFVIAGNPIFLDPYDRGRTAESGAFATAAVLAAAVGGDAPALLAVFQDAADRWHRDVAEPNIDLVRQGRQAEVMTAPAAARAKSAFDRVRATSAALSSYLEGRRADQTRERDHLSRRVTQLLFGLALLGLVGLALLVYISRQSERLRLRAARTEAARLAMDEFLSIASHEIKTPITVVKGQAQALRSVATRLDGTREERRRTAVRITQQSAAIDRAATRLQRLVEQLLDVSRLDADRLALSFEEFDLTALVERVVEAMRPAAPGHQIVVQHHGPLRVEADEDHVEQVLYNLLTNAVKYAPGAPRIVVRLWRDGDMATCAVRDHGIGIPAEAHGHLAERFFRAGNVAVQRIGGMGVGLYLSLEIIARHGGVLYVHSVEGAGTIIGFSLPLAGRPPTERPASGSLVWLDSAGKEDVLARWLAGWDASADTDPAPATTGDRAAGV